MSKDNFFQYVLIPSDDTKPIQALSADSSGGLLNDALVIEARKYFHEITGAKERLVHLKQLDPAGRKEFAEKIRQEMSTADGSSKIEDLDDDTVLDMVYQSQAQATCDIMALTIPTKSNQYQAISLYAADNAQQIGLAYNARATALLTACGHSAANGGVFGDALVGRAIDNEIDDIWKRVDFTIDDADPSSEWCRQARQPGGGGGSGSGAASSLSGLINKNIQAIDGSAGQTNSLFGSKGAPPVQEDWGSWTQDDDEVEIKFNVAAGTIAKNCKVSFQQNALKIAVEGQILLQGRTFDPIATDECTFTLQDEGTSGRELSVTLSKREPRTWSYVVQ